MVVILDDFDKNNLEGLINYTSGTNFVKNFIILDKNDTDFGFNTIYYASTLEFSIFVDATLVSFTGTMEQVANLINKNTTMRDNGIQAEIINYYKSYSTALLFIVEGTSAKYTDITVRLKTGEYTGSVPGTITPIVYDAKFNNQDIQVSYVTVDTGAFPTTLFYRLQYAYITLMPFGDNQITNSKDLESILAYGKNLHAVKNYEWISSTKNKQDLLDNKLDELKDPRARCFADVPFDYQQIKELDEIEVRLSYQNTGKFQSFKEGGHFKSWEDAGTYRTKTFYTMGIEQVADGTQTRHRLMEKI